MTTVPEKDVHRPPSDDLYSLIFNSVNDIIVVHDAVTGRPIEVNQRCADVFGYSKEEFLSLTIEEWSHSDPSFTQRRALEFIQKAARGEPQLFEWLCKKKDGSLFWTEVSLQRATIQGRGVILAVVRNIDERKKADTRLATEYAFRNAVIDKAGEGICVCHAINDFPYVEFSVWNNRMVEITGYSLEEINQRGWYQSLYPDPDIQAKAVERMSRMRIGDDIIGEEWEITRKDGKVRSVRISTSIIEKATDDVHVLALIHDVTSLKNALESLRQEHELLERIAETSPAGITFVNAEGQIVYANEKAQQVLGLKRSEITCRYFNSSDWKITDFAGNPFPEEQLPFFQVKKKKAPVFNLQHAIERQDGQRVLLSINAVPNFDAAGRFNGMVATIDNVTDQWLAERALQESEEKYRKLVENATDAIFIAQDFAIKFPNKRALEILGYSGEELKHIPFAQFIHPDDREMVVDRHSRRMGGERNLPTTYSLRVINKHGLEYHVELNAVMIDWEGKPATINFVRDITEQKRLEASLQQSRKMEAVGTLAGGIAHDFNNILMGIQGRASFILSEIDYHHPYYEHMKRIEECVKSASDLTNQLLGFARGGKYEVKPIDMNRVMEQTSRMFGRTRKEIRIVKKYEPEIWIVEADSRQMEQVLLNLLVNAWQAMPEGGTIYLQSENLCVEKKYDMTFPIEDGRYVRISVTDTGEGIDEAVKSRLFDPFYTTKEKGRGVGLGLASVYGIIKNHNGFIHVHSQKGKGATFTIYLPASDKKMDEDRFPIDSEKKGMGTILIVDDEEMIIDVAGLLLNKLGYDVLVARSGKEAIEMFRRKKEQVDAVILDMIMPGLGGDAVYDELKKLDPKVKVLLSSGYSINGQAGEILNKGCNGFIQKPFTIRQLAQHLNRILQ